MLGHIFFGFTRVWRQQVCLPLEMNFNDALSQDICMKVHDLFHTCFQTYLGEGMLYFFYSKILFPVVSLSLWGELCRSQIPPATWEGGLLEWGLGHSDSEGFPEVFSFESFEACLQMISMSQQIPTLPNMWQWAFLSKLLWVVTSFMLKLGNGVKQTHLPKSGQAWTCRAFTWTPHRSSDQHVYTHITPNSKD